jgi:hypothetical protein
MPSPEDLLRFQAISDALLKRHYGVSMEDTPLRDLRVVSWFIDAYLSPHEAVNQFVEACGWLKHSLVWSFPGSFPSNYVTLEEEMEVIMAHQDRRVLH